MGQRRSRKRWMREEKTYADVLIDLDLGHEELRDAKVHLLLAELGRYALVGRLLYSVMQEMIPEVAVSAHET